MHQRNGLCRIVGAVVSQPLALIECVPWGVALSSGLRLREVEPYRQPVLPGRLSLARLQVLEPPAGDPTKKAAVLRRAEEVVNLRSLGRAFDLHGL